MTEQKTKRVRTLRRRLSHFVGPIAFYRVGRFLVQSRLGFIAGFFRYLGVLFFGADINQAAKIGARFSLPHFGLGVVVGKYAVIGDECVLMPGVLIGATLVNHEMPLLEDAVVVGAGAKVLGPITIGRGAVIAANSVVTSDVPPFCLVAGNPARVIKENISVEDMKV